MGAGMAAGSQGIALGGLDFGLGMAGISLPPSGPGAQGGYGAGGYGAGFGAPPQQQQQPFGGGGFGSAPTGFGAAPNPYGAPPAAKPAAAFNPFDM